MVNISLGSQTLTHIYKYLNAMVVRLLPVMAAATVSVGTVIHW
jgi:hypothetical protein